MYDTDTVYKEVIRHLHAFMQIDHRQYTRSLQCRYLYLCTSSRSLIQIDVFPVSILVTPRINHTQCSQINGRLGLNTQRPASIAVHSFLAAYILVWSRPRPQTPPRRARVGHKTSCTCACSNHVITKNGRALA